MYENKTVHVDAVRTVGDFEWCLKSTTVERGRALMGIALEWTGDGTHYLDERESVGHAAEQVINLLAFVAHRFGDAAALKVIAEATARGEDWLDQE